MGLRLFNHCLQVWPLLLIDCEATRHRLVDLVTVTAQLESGRFQYLAASSSLAEKK